MTFKLVYIESDQTFTGSNGKEYKGRNYYLLLDSGRLLAIKPSFDDDKKVFSLLAEKYVK